MKTGSEIRQLTGIRGIAAMTVALVHLHFDQFQLIRLIEFHDQAVDLFFCLSGFTLCMVYQAGSGKKLNIARYMIARFARIYPLYALVLLFCWWQTVRHLAGAPFYPQHLFIADLIRNVLLVNSWPLIGDGSNWDSPAWSLSVEAFCYVLIFPALFFVSSSALKWPASGRLICLAVLSFMSLVAFSLFWDVQILIARVYTASHQISYFIPVTRGVTMFAAGWLVHGFWKQAGSIAIAAGIACDSIMVVAFMILGCAFLGILPKACLILMIPPLILALAVNEKAISARFLSSPPIHFLGEISYAIYLLHEPLASFVTSIFPALSSDPVLYSFVILPILIAISTMSFYGFENPLRKKIKQLSPAKAS